MNNPDITGLVLLMVSHFFYILLFAILIITLNGIFRDTENKFLLLVRTVINDVKFSFRNPLLSVLLPVLIITAVFFALRAFIQPSEYSISPNLETLAFMIVLVAITGPVAEEIIQCVTLSAVFVIEKDIFEKCSFQKTNLRFYGFLILFLVLYAVYMAYFHDNRDIVSFSIRAFCFIIYGLLYLVNDRNIVPPVIAHGTWNLLVITDSLEN